jgi:parallel beta-helix repeat protein
MTLSRRDVLKYSLSGTALAGLGAAAATGVPAKASADDLQSNAVNVRDYGAIGDGTADDTAAIHAARDAAGAGGKIIVPPGVYMVSGLTADVADQKWELSVDAVIKMEVGAAEILSVNAAGVSVVGGLFDASNGTARDWSQQGIRISGDGVTVRNVTVQNSPAIGVYALNCSQLTISGCTFTDNWYCGIFVQNGRPSAGVYDILINDNLVKGSSDAANGIYVRGNSGTELVHRVVISGNTVILPHNQTGVETGAILLFYGVDWSITNNIARGGDLGITCPVPTKAMISNNAVSGFSSVGIEIPGVVDSVTIAGNVIDPDGTSATSGIQTSAGAVNDVRIVGNTIKNFTASCYLIDFNSGSISQGVTINGNFLSSAVESGSFNGVYFNGSITGLVMSGNIVDGASSRSAWGVHFLGSVSGAIINANRFANLPGAAVLLGASDASDTLDHINVVGNAVTNCGAILKDSTTNGAVVGTTIFT